MNAPTLDPRPALVLIDLQEGIVGQTMAHPTDAVVRRAADLAAAARQKGLPVILVNVAGGAPGRNERPRPNAAPSANWTDLVSEVATHDDDIRVTKLRWNAFSNPALDEKLHELGVTQIILAGIATSMGVESTARSAHERGYNVLLVTDAMTDASPDAHHNSIERIFPMLGERTSTAEAITAIEIATS